MRPVMLGDVRTAARAMLAVPAGEQIALCQRLLREADWADRYTRRRAKPHYLWGNGTLLGAASHHVLAPEPTFDDVAYCRAFAIVLGQLVARRTPQVL